MAGDWIKMRLDLQTHPKIVRILSATASDKFRVVGGLHAVWSVFDTHSADGKLDGYSPETLDHVIGWPGFSAAMMAAGWLTQNDDSSLSLPEFDEHNGASGKRRAEDQKRKRNERKSPQSVRNLSAKEPDGKLTREEKRREELNKELNDDSTAYDFDPPTAAPLPAGEPIAEPQDAAIILAVAMRKMGVQANSAHPAVQGWAAAGVTVEMIGEAVGTARISKPTGNIPANYLAPIVDDLLHPPAARTPSQSRAAPVNEKFNFGHLDHSSSARAMAESMERHGITLPPPDEEIEL